MIDRLSRVTDDVTEWLMREPDTIQHKLLRTLQVYLRIIYAVGRDLVHGPLSLHAMSLVYTTILSIVPMLALSFSVLKTFNVQDRFTPMLYGFFEPMGEKGLEIYNNVLTFVDNIKVGVLGFVGFLLLFYTVVSLVQKIEKAFNLIWYAPELRSVSQRFTNYLTVVLVGPVVMVSAISVTASMMNSSLVRSVAEVEPLGMMIVMVSKLMPFVMIIATFTFFYKLMPNTQVNFKSALVGGIVGGGCWQATSLLFTSFVVGSTKYDAIYSSFAVGILLLIWLYVNWLILLVGSSIAFYHQHGSNITRDLSVDTAPEVIEKVGLDIMIQVALSYESNSGPITQGKIEKRHYIPAVMTRKIIDKLIAAGLLLEVGEKSEGLAPGHSTDQITVAEVLRALRADTCDLMHYIYASGTANRLVKELDTVVMQHLDKRTIRDLVIEENKAPEDGTSQSLA